MMSDGSRLGLPPFGESSDDLDSLGLDKDFIRGGRHEPPARTREAIARYGGRRTSWRHAGAADDESQKEVPRGGRRRWSKRRLVLIGAALLTVGALIAVLMASGLGLMSGPSTGIARPGRTIDPGQGASAQVPSASSQDVVGAGPSNKVGTCYTSPDPHGAEGSLVLAVVDCLQPHTFELASLRQAIGNNDTYPAPAYWEGTVAQACSQDLTGYLSKPRSRWPARVSSYAFYPKADSWRIGNRTVYCVALTEPPNRGSLRSH